MPQINHPEYGTWFAVTKSDTTRISCRALYIGGTGDVTVSPDGTTAGTVFTALPVGTILRLNMDQGRVMAATTATLIVAMY